MWDFDLTPIGERYIKDIWAILVWMDICDQECKNRPYNSMLHYCCSKDPTEYYACIRNLYHSGPHVTGPVIGVKFRVWY